MAHDKHPPIGYLEDRGVNLSRVYELATSPDEALLRAEFAVNAGPDLWVPLDSPYYDWVIENFSGRGIKVRSKLHHRRIILQHQQETFPLLKDADPIIYSYFDIYLKGKSLIYVRDNCSSEDINIRFFLHIYPIQQSDLPYLRKQYGFNNHDFSFKKFDGFFDGQHCIVVRHLPDYDIAKITTGQFVKDRRIWSGTFTFM